MPCNDCSIKCKERYTSWYSKRKDFDCMPIGHVLPHNYLIENDIISLEKNDELLLNYIIKNCSNLEEVCYFDITMDIISGLGKLMLIVKIILSKMSILREDLVKSKKIVNIKKELLMLGRGNKN